MSRRGMTAAVLALVACALTAPAGPAGAVMVQGKEAAIAAFRIEGTNGYRGIVLATADSKGKAVGLVVLANRRGDGVSYSGPATLTPTSFEMDLGVVGKISLAFRSSGPEAPTKPSCGGRPAGFEPGVFEGSIALHGEEGFTDVEATSVPFDPRLFLDLFCSSAGQGELGGRGLPGARLTVSAGKGAMATTLQVNENRPGASVRLSAEIGERRGALEIHRFVERTIPGARQAFSFDKRLHSASLRPGAPFSGSATFSSSGPAAHRWRGNLKLDFPGRAGVPMTGAGFHPKLVHAELQRHVIRHRPGEERSPLHRNAGVRRAASGCRRPGRGACSRRLVELRRCPTRPSSS
jgi:hypothetical protein